MYWVIFAWPVWPSCRSASSRGMTTASSCRMMLAVMYGMMPSANTVSFVSELPLNRLSSWKMPVVLAPGQTGVHCRVRHARRRQLLSEPEHGDDKHREEQFLAQVRRSERPDERGQHAPSPTP